ncbi:MAG: pyrroline-5-carboxylate reductase [Pseudanabaenaceae cyanobacterium]
MELGIIGGGVMGEAILSRLLSLHLYSPELVCVSDPQPDRCRYLRDKYGITTTSDNQQPAQAPVLLLAVKPQSLESALSSIQVTAELVISILAGTTLAKLEQLLPQRAIVRAMPNTPAQVGAGITAISANSRVTPAQAQLAEQILQSIGAVVTVPEPWLDAVTGVSGSGPAYVAIFIEALADGGVHMGLPRALAHTLAIETVLGTAQLLKTTGLHPAQLKDQVASPGGTTMAGIAVLESAGLRSALIQAVKAAVERAQALGR